MISLIHTNVEFFNLDTDTTIDIGSFIVISQNILHDKILLPKGKAPRKGRGHSQSITRLVTKSFRSPPAPGEHANRVKNA